MLQHATCCLTYNRKYSIWSTLYYKSHASSTWLTPRCPAWVQGSYDRSTPNPTIIIQVEPRPALGHIVSTICKPRMIHVAFNNTVYSECNMYNVHFTCTLYNVQCTMYNVQCTMYNVQCTCKMYITTHHLVGSGGAHVPQALVSCSNWKRCYPLASCWATGRLCPSTAPFYTFLRGVWCHQLGEAD